MDKKTVMLVKRAVADGIKRMLQNAKPEDFGLDARYEIEVCSTGKLTADIRVKPPVGHRLYYQVKVSEVW